MNKIASTYISVLTLLLTTNTKISQAKLPNLNENLTNQHCFEPGEVTETLCESTANETIPVFHTRPIFPDVIQLDIRPENCQSFFDDYLHTRRGLRIESALEASAFYNDYTNTVETFPIVDFISNGHVRIVKTRDLLVDSFNNGSNNDSLFEQIITDATEIFEQLLNRLQREGEISATSNGVTTSISVSDVQFVTLDIIIQSGMANESHVNQIKRAKAELKKRWGFNLQVIEIP